MSQGFFPSVSYVPPPPSSSRAAAPASNAASATPTAPAPKVAGNGNGAGNSNGKGGGSNVGGSSGTTVNLTANALAAVNSTPASTSTSTSTRPDSSSSQSFDFALPSFPPRLSKVGRRISELSTQFLNELDLPDEPSSAGGGGGGTGAKRISSEKPREEVPGMGDEPVMCPFCEKPLPPALFERMAHQQNHRRPGPPSRSATATSARGFGGGWNEAAARAAVGVSSPSISVSRSSSLPPQASASASLSTSAPPSASPLAMAGGIGMTMSQSAIPASTPKLLDPLPVSSPRPNPQSATIPASTTAQDAAPAAAVTASASSLLSTVQQAETAETFASSSTISPDDLARWSTLAGIPLAPAPQPTTATTSSTTSTSGPDPVLEKAKVKAIPAIPPPPPAAERFQPPARTSSAGSGRFGFFRRGSRPKEDDDESEDEDHASGAGYAKLTAPGSPDLESDDEVDGFVKRKAKAKDAAATETAKPAEQESAGETTGETAGETEPVKEDRPTDGNGTVSKPGDNGVKVDGEESQGQSQSDAELRKVLQEVLNKVNAMSKSHSDLVASHTGLLTSLKIARSNLAMAEANTEMLEAQLKQRGPPSTLPGAVTSPVVAKAQAVVAAGGTPSGAVVPRPPVTPGTSKSVTSGGVAGTPTPGSGVSYAVRKSPERARPPSLQIPRTDLSNAGPATGPAASTSETKGWGFWQGGKKKLPGGLGSLTIPSAAQIASALDSTTRPTTPTSEKRSLDFARSPVAPFSSALPDIHSMPRSPGGGGGGLHRSSSSVNLPATSAPTSATARSAAAEAELSRLHAAYKVTVSKMDGMAKELAELKKGKVEMEAELESLSQALFEEANKMVADERRKRAEVEEALKEVKEEREALRQTIKVLGGRVDEAEGAGAEVDEAGGDGARTKAKKKEKTKEEDKGVKTPEEFDEELFVPRDLDKHYAALRKTIHHVSDGATGGTEVTSTSPLDAFAAAIGADTGGRAGAGVGVDGDAGADGGDEHDGILIVGPGSTTVPAEPGATPPKLRAISAPTSPNPWAEVPAIAPAIEMQAPTPSPRAPTTDVGGDGGGVFGHGEASGGLGLAVGEEQGGALELELERGKGSGSGKETGTRSGPEPEPPMSPVEELDKLMDKLREDMD